MRQAFIWAALALGAGLAPLDPAAAGEHSCAASVASHLDRHSIQQADVKNVDIVARRGNPEFGTILGYDAWVSLDREPRRLVIKMNRRCEVREAYDRNGDPLASPVY